MAELCPAIEQQNSFLEELFAAERNSLVGEASFDSVLSAVLEKYQSSATLSSALKLWKQIELQEPVIQALQEFRSDGIKVCLASNQQDYRASYMRSSVGYVDSFDEFLLSCELGAIKPSAEFFQATLRKIESSPEQALLIDDSPENIEAARAFGLKAELFSFRNGIDKLNRLLNQHIRGGA